MSSALTVFNVLVGFFSCLLATLILKPRSKGDVVHISGPTGGHWLWGHELEAFRQEATQAHAGWLRQFGPAVIKIKGALFHHDILVLTDNTAVKHIFQNCYLYGMSLFAYSSPARKFTPNPTVKSPVFRPLVRNIVGEGLVWTEGDMHKQHRRILQPAFTAESVKEMAPHVIEAAELLRLRLTEHVSSASKSTVNIVEWTTSTTLDIIGKVGFGHDFQGGQSPDAQKILQASRNQSREAISMTGFIALLLLRTFPFITRLPIRAIKRQGELKVVVGRLARAIVQSGKAGSSRGGKDVLSTMLLTNEQDPSALSEKHVIDNISTLVIAGTDTTANAVSFTLLSLARAPAIQSKLRMELLDARARRDPLSYDHINSLTYLDAVAKEAMRMHPSSPRTERIVLEDDVLPLHRPIKSKGGKVLTSLSLKAGQVIHIPFLCMHTSRDIWGDDAEVFKPERWLSDDSLPPHVERLHGWSGLLTFIDGPRSCIGYRLAVYEFKVILATLIQQFEFEPTDARVQRYIAPVMQPVVEGRGGYLPLKVSLV